MSYSILVRAVHSPVVQSSFYDTPSIINITIVVVVVVVVVVIIYLPYLKIFYYVSSYSISKET